MLRSGVCAGLAATWVIFGIHAVFVTVVASLFVLREPPRKTGWRHVLICVGTAYAIAWGLLLGLADRLPGGADTLRSLAALRPFTTTLEEALLSGESGAARFYALLLAGEIGTALAILVYGVVPGRFSGRVRAMRQPTREAPTAPPIALAFLFLFMACGFVWLLLTSNMEFRSAPIFMVFLPVIPMCAVNLFAYAWHELVLEVPDGDTRA